MAPRHFVRRIAFISLFVFDEGDGRHMHFNTHSLRRTYAIALGKFFFGYRNVLGPAIFLLALALSRPQYPLGRQDLNIAFDAAGVVLVLLGQLIRVVTIGYEYIVRGGRNRHVYADDLVQGGMFALSRNPLYFGNVLIAVGLALVITPTRSI